MTGNGHGAVKGLKKKTGITVNKLTADDIIRIVERWKKSVVDLDNLLYEDARKEFTLIVNDRIWY